jgi:SAM-dependent methyltransferase
MPSGADGSVARVREVFDSFGGEWERLRKDVAGRVSLEIHQRFLDEYLTPGARVLEVGAGPGTFTQHLAAGGARLTVTDLSPVQLAEDAPAALRELLRVTGAGGTVLASVMSTLGSCRHLMPDVVNLIAEYGTTSTTRSCAPGTCGWSSRPGTCA